MSWAGSKRWDLYLGSRAVALCDRTGVVFAEEATSAEAAIARAAAHLDQAQHAPSVRIWLSGGLCRPFIVPRVVGLRRGAEELQRVAQSMLEARTGLDGECDVWLEPIRSHDSALAIAVRRSYLLELESRLGHRAKLASIAPWWAEVLRLVLASETTTEAIGIQDCDSLTVLAGKHDSFEIARTVAPILDREAAEAAWMRALLSTELERGEDRFARLDTSKRAQGNDCALGQLLELPR